MLLDDIERVLEDSYRRLLQISRPPVKYFLLTDIGGRRRSDPLVQQTLRECMVYPPRVKLLETLRPDGTWPIPRQRRLAEQAGPGPPVGWTYITMLRNLFMLSGYQAEREEGCINACLEKILGWQTKEGYIPGPWTDLFPLPHYNGFALRAFMSFGLEEDKRVQMLIKWLLDMQRPDGGWIIPYIEDVRYLPEYRYMRVPDFMDLIRKGEIKYGSPEKYADVPSCTWSTLLVLRGMVLSYKLPRTPQARKAADFVLDRFFKKNPHPAFLRSEDNWTRLKYPTYFGSGLLALDIATWMGHGADDPRLEKPIRWLLGARGQDGLWSQSDRPNSEKDQWISEVAISILNRYAESLRGEQFGIEAEMAKGDPPTR